MENGDIQDCPPLILNVPVFEVAGPPAPRPEVAGPPAPPPEIVGPPAPPPEVVGPPAPNTPAKGRKGRPKVGEIDVQAKVGSSEKLNIRPGQERAELEALFKEREHARMAKESAQSPEALTIARNEMKLASERLGEKGADIAIKRKYPDAKLEYKGKGTADLDAVYKVGDEYVVVEAKGGSSPLRTRKLPNGKIVQQGTREYLVETIRLMKAKGGEAARVARELEQALANGKLKYLKSEVPIRQSGGKEELKDIVLSEFDISP